MLEKKIKKQKKITKEIMVCSVKGCGREDKSFTAYCIKHGRSPHHIIKVEEKSK